MINLSDYKEELKFAKNVVKKATEITEWFKGDIINSFNKKDDSPVTLADLASQAYILSEIKNQYPEDLITAEEDSRFINNKAEALIRKCYSDLGLNVNDNLEKIINYKGKEPERQWIVDPIDGTLGYIKNESYAVAVGLMIDSEPHLSAIALPHFKEYKLAVFIAQKNKGAKVSYENNSFKPINVSNTQNIEDCTLIRSVHHDLEWTEKLGALVGVKEQIQMDGMGKFCLVAEGSVDMYIRPLECNEKHIWDCCPGDLLVREASGKVTDYNGNNLQYQEKICELTTSGYLASNGIIHEKVLKEINEYFSKNN